MKITKRLKLIYYLISLVSFLLLVRVTFAQEVFKFFEFAPRSQEKIIITNNVLEENFIPFNEFLSGLGLFINNHEIRDLEITILDKNGRIFWQKRVSFPIINGGWWGAEYFISLDDNYPINSGEKYKLVIRGYSTTSTDLFVKNILEILQGTETYLYFPENLKKLKLDGQETNYTLKLALYENKENVPPVITNLRIEITNSQTAEILFNSNEPITYLVQYKSNFDTGSSTVGIDYFENCPYQIRDCQIALDVAPGRNYNFILLAYDYWQNKTEKEGNFQTPEEVQKTTTSFQEGNSETTTKPFNQIQINQTQSPNTQKLKDSSINQNQFLSSGRSNDKTVSQQKRREQPKSEEQILLETRLSETGTKETQYTTSIKEQYFEKENIFQQPSRTSTAYEKKSIFDSLKSQRAYIIFTLMALPLLFLIFFFKKIKK